MQYYHIKIIPSKGSHWAFTLGDFSELGDPRHIGMVLTRLVREGKVRRVTQGLYDIPHKHPVLGQVGAGPDALVRAVARKKKLRVLPSAEVAANQLGLSTQVPATMVYHTDGAPASLQVGKLSIEFRRNTGKMLSLHDRPAGLVIQALRAFGPDGVSPDHVEILKQRLSVEDKRSLKEDRLVAPAWMRPYLDEIAEGADS